MKKVTLMFVVVFFFIVSNASASNSPKTEKKPQIISIGKEVEVKDQATKMFIYDTMQVWMRRSLDDFYHNKYHANSIRWRGPELEGIRIWIQQVVAPSEYDGVYTHLIRISLQRDELIINDKKKMKTTDTFTYAVNAHLLSLCPETGKSEKEFKILRFHHEVRP